MTTKIVSHFRNGIVLQNPVFVLMAGMCPALAVSTTVYNGIGMGICVTAVLTLSNIAVSALRRILPESVRTAAYVIIISALVTMTDMLLRAYVPELSESLGIFIPLIAVNGVVLMRAELFAEKNGVLESAADGFAMGLGFTCALIAVSAVRELLGAGTLMGFDVMPGDFQPALYMALAPGGFLTLGFIAALTQAVSRRAAAPPSN